MAEFENNDQRGDIFSKAVRAGKRTYFFDVRSTRSNDYYLTITESKRKFTEGSDRPFFEKHKIFLYKEDFDKFVDGMKEALDHIREHQPPVENQEFHHTPAGNPAPAPASAPAPGFTSLEFDDLGK